MKRWCLSGYVFLAVVAALLLTVAVGAQNTCEVANASLDAGLYEDALKAYAELLKNDTYRNCTLAGISELRQASANKSYELGKAYEEVKQYKSARDAYTKALEIDSGCNKAQTALTNVSNPFAEVRTLLNMGLYTEAGERLKEAIKENPGDVPEGLKYHFMRNMSAWGYFRIWTEPFIRPIGEILTFVGIGLLIVWLIYLWIGYSRKPRLDIQDFDKGATDLDLGKGLAAMVEVSFKQIGELGAHGRGPRLIEGPIEKLEIPADVKSLHPYSKIVSALFEWLFRPDVYILSGCLQKPGGDLGAGLTLTLVRKKTGEIMANRTIWQKEFDLAITPPEEKDPVPYYRLAEPAAIWTLFHEVLAFNKKLTPFGTENWLSFAYFRAGVRCTLEGKEDKARQLYLVALKRDTNNRGALFNLGVLNTEDGEYERAIKRLERARKKYLFCWDTISDSKNDKERLRRFLVDDLGIRWAENAKIYKNSQDNNIYITKKNITKYIRPAKIKLNAEVGKVILTTIYRDKILDLKVEKDKDKQNIYKHFLKEPVWYKATYQLAATHHYQGRQQQAENEAENLVTTIQETIKILQKTENKKLRDFLESFRPMACIMYAAIVVGTNKNESPKLQVNITESDSTELSYEIITCEGGNSRSDPYTAKLTYRSHYDLACYYSESDNNEDAWEHLKYALERGGEIVQWAQKDPSLEKLREDKKGDFDKLIKNCSAPVTPSADLLLLAGLRLIGATYAKQLKEQGIVSHDDLILKAKNCHAREELAKKLCIDPELLQRWALLADMMRIVGIDTQYANLLDAAGVHSLDDLTKKDPQKIVDLLCKLDAQFLVKQLLSVEIVKRWKEEANIIDPKVIV
ncbi:Tetratricopeptide (TPR) repeat [Methanophagales archaeon]|nr:Tetratricopeptide (TPR) repeat [Methanophagales archaeon]